MASSGSKVTAGDYALLQSRPIVTLRQANVQSVSDANLTQCLKWDTEEIDTGNMWDPLKPTRVTISQPGIYEFGGGVAFAFNTTGRRGSWWRKNSAVVLGSAAIFPALGGLMPMSARTYVLRMAAGDYMELLPFQDSGGPLDTANGVTGEGCNLFAYRLSS